MFFPFLQLLPNSFHLPYTYFMIFYPLFSKIKQETGKKNQNKSLHF